MKKGSAIDQVNAEYAKIERFYYSSELVSREQPKNLKYEDIALFSTEFNKQFNSILTKVIKNTFLLHNGFCLTNIEYLHTCNIKHKFKVIIKSLLQLIYVRKIRRFDYAVLLTDINSSNFFHWFCDVLQKIEALRGHDIELNGIQFIVPSNTNLDLLIATSNIYNISFTILEKNQIALIDKVIIVPQISPTGNYRPSLIRNIRSRFIQKYGYKSLLSRIYITRSKAIKRKILNEESIIDVLKRFNFTIVAMEDLNFEAQLKLVMGAEVLITLHGAGLTHMLWMNPRSKVMEIRLKGDEVNNCYFSLASDLNLDYYYCLADKVNPKVPTQLTDFIVSPIELERQLSVMLS